MHHSKGAAYLGSIQQVTSPGSEQIYKPVSKSDRPAYLAYFRLIDLHYGKTHTHMNTVTPSLHGQLSKYVLRKQTFG